VGRPNLWSTRAFTTTAHHSEKKIGRSNSGVFRRRAYIPGLRVSEKKSSETVRKAPVRFELKPQKLAKQAEEAPFSLLQRYSELLTQQTMAGINGLLVPVLA
jgi:hypothetical protein